MASIVKSVDQIDGLKGTGILFYGQDSCEVIRIASNSKIFIVIEEQFVVRETDTSLPAIISQQQIIKNSRFGEELRSAGFDCGFAIANTILFKASLAAGPATAFTSHVVAAAMWTGVVTGWLQCTNGAMRVLNEMRNPTLNEELDSNLGYLFVKDAVDATNTAAGLISLGSGVRQIYKTASSKYIVSKDSIRLLEGSKQLNAGAKAKNWKTVYKRLDKATQKQARKQLKIKTAKNFRQRANFLLPHATKFIEQQQLEILNSAIRELIQIENLLAVAELTKSEMDENSVMRRLPRLPNEDVLTLLPWISLFIVQSN